MGYTNYWYMKQGLKKFPEGFVNDCETLTKAWNERQKELGNDMEIKCETEGNFLVLSGSGVTYEGFEIYLNQESFPREPKKDLIFNFCKTAREPYDSLVKGIVMLGVKHGIFAEWAFDGDTEEEEWKEAELLMGRCGFETVSPRD